MALNTRQLEAIQNQRKVAEETRQMIWASCSFDEIVHNKYLREALYGN